MARPDSPRNPILLGVLVLAATVLVGGRPRPRPNPAVGGIHFALPDRVEGHACIPGDPDTHLEVEFFYGGPRGEGQPLGSTIADAMGQDPIAGTCGDPAHRFVFVYDGSLPGVPFLEPEVPIWGYALNGSSVELNHSGVKSAAPNFADFNRVAIEYAYQQLFAEPPEASELESWSDALDLGTSPQEMVLTLTASPEFQARIAPMSDFQYINWIWFKLRWRDPKPDAHASWMNRLQNGETRQDLVEVLVTGGAASDGREFVEANLPLFCEEATASPGFDPSLPFCTVQHVDPDDTIDGLDFLLTDDETVRLGRRPLSHNVNQVIFPTLQKMYNINWISGPLPDTSFYIFFWDDDAVYFQEDSSPPHRDPYAPVIPMPWLKRAMHVGETIENPSTWYEEWETRTAPGGDCVPKVEPFRQWANEVTLERHLPAFNVQRRFGTNAIEACDIAILECLQQPELQGQLFCDVFPERCMATQDVIVLLWYYHSPHYERFFYSREWGWIGHEKWRDTDPGLAFSFELEKASYYDVESADAPFGFDDVDGWQCSE